MAESPIGPEVTSKELAMARRAFRGSLESSRAWRGFSTDPRHHDVTYWTLLTVLFIDPGLNRMSLIDRVIEFAGISRSTAERAIREARSAGFIVDEPSGKEVRYRLSERLFAHCLEFFRSFMDVERNMARLEAGGDPPHGRQG